MAQTGFLVNFGGGEWTCAVDSAAAIVALGARFPYVGGSAPMLCNLEGSSFVAPDIFNNDIKCHNLAGNQVYQYTHDLRLARCDPAVDTTAFMDGMAIGWGIVGAMVAALAVIYIKQAFFR